MPKNDFGSIKLECCTIQLRVLTSIPKENLWADVKKADGDAKPKNYKELLVFFDVDGMLYLVRGVGHLWTPWEGGVQP